jgi:hypothetical protein
MITAEAVVVAAFIVIGVAALAWLYFMAQEFRH